MGKLEDVEKQLYEKEQSARGGGFEGRRRSRVWFGGSSSKVATSWIGSNKKEEPQNSSQRNIVSYVLFGGGALFLILAAVFVWFYLGTKGEEVEISIPIREEIEAGEFLTIPVVFENITDVSLKEVELTLILPSDTLIREGAQYVKTTPRIIKKLDDVYGKEARTVEFPVRMFGREGDEKTIEAILSYRQENLRAKFIGRHIKTVRIARVPLSLSWEIPEIVASEQEINIKIRYASEAATQFENALLRLEYPSGFRFISSEPAPDEDAIFWRLGVLEKGKEGSIVIRGVLSGDQEEIKTFRAALGARDEDTRVWSAWREVSVEAHIAPTLLSLQPSLEGVSGDLVSPGDTLNVLLHYKNNTQFPLRNVMVSVVPEGKSHINTSFNKSGTTDGSGLRSSEDMVDLETLSIRDGGVYDASRRAIVWASSAVPELREVSPGEEGELHFSVRMRERPIVRTAQDKNFSIRFRTVITTPTPPEELQGTDLSQEVTLEFKVRSKTIIAGKAVYRTSPIFNSGSLPPRVGGKTAYTIIFEIKNFTNDLENAEIRILLPPNVTWEGVFFPTERKFNFDSASGEVRWTIGMIKAGTGVLTPTLTGAFQVSVTPAISDIGKPLILGNDARLVARDVFTKEPQEVSLGSFSTELREDPATKAEDWVVAK